MVRVVTSTCQVSPARRLDTGRYTCQVLRDWQASMWKRTGLVTKSGSTSKCDTDGSFEERKERRILS